MFIKINNKIMKKYLLIQLSNRVYVFTHSATTALTAIAILISIVTSAQTNNISLSGIVVDEKTKTPLEGATVHIKGTTHEVVTDKLGDFKFITGQKVPVVYIVSFVGYQTQEFSVSETSGVQLAIKEANTQLNEVVVVGYGTQSRKSLIGAITKVDPSQTKTIPGGSFDAQLQGKTAGVQINSNSGIPGQDAFIRVRGATSIYGSNDPLYVIDGVFINTTNLQQISQQRTPSPIADINPSDIESIEILKDASAVGIYGSRGANGVVIVTTKKGNYQQAPKIDLSVTNGYSWVPKEREWKTTTGPLHAELINEYYTNQGATVLPFRALTDNPTASLAPRGLPQDQPTYDRMQYLDHQAAPLRNYSLSLHGGSKDTRYYIGAGYDSEDAIWNPISFNRASLKINLDQKIGNKVTVSTANTLSRTHRDLAFAANGGLGTLLQASLNIPTYLPIFLADGTPAKWVNFDNITYLTNNVNIKSNSLHYIGNVAIDVAILQNLKFRSSFGVDYDNYNESQYWGANTLIGASPTNGLASSAITQSSTLVNEQTLNYNTTLGKHTFGALVGNTLQSNEISGTSATGTNFPNSSYTLVSQAASQTAGQSWTKNSLVSFFSRINYSYNRKYFVEFSLRADASSRFAKDKRWGYFPSIGAAWNIKQENFLASAGALSTLKLKGSAGITGNQNGINDFASKGLWTAGYGYSDTTGAAEQPGTAPYQLANPDLRWEKTSQINGGLDIGLFKDKVSIELNYYYKYTNDVLLKVPVPATMGFGYYYANYGAVSNKGFEVSIASLNLQHKNLTWRTEFNISQNLNKVEKLLTPINDIDASRNLVQIQEGSPLYSYWLYKQLYVDPNTGNAIFQKADGSTSTANGAVATDRQIVGSTWPKFFGGLTNSFTSHNFDLNVFFTYQLGNYVWNHNRMLGETGGTLDAQRVLLASQLDRWTTKGQVTDVPKLTKENYSIQANSRFFEDGSFVRLRAITLGYTLPKAATSSIGFQAIRLFFSANNLFLITKYKGADPETNLGGNQNLQGYDYAIPPQPRSIQFGLNVTL